MTKKTKPDNPVLKGIGGALKTGFDAVSKGTDKGLNHGGSAIREVLNIGEKVATDAVGIAEKIVGKERVEGAALGVKVDGTIGMIGGIPGMIKGGVIGGAVGFVGGKKLVDWYHKPRGGVEESNDNVKANPPPVIYLPPPSKGPDDPSP